MAQQQPQSKLPPRARYAANNRKYGTPLPILFPSSSSTSSKSILTSFLPSLSSARVEIQHITGEYDPTTGSVWITDPKMMDLAFQKGFFGKGSLSRSEPSWRARRVGLLKGGDSKLYPFPLVQSRIKFDWKEGQRLTESFVCSICSSSGRADAREETIGA